ncbi:histidine kinase [Sphingomonas panacis]|uniref:histidine kinase n=1 Tax=Sphingomonas panacis TaxID=1560345 RepID=A0A1B3ZGX6_9SPHN|nr:histidine kinase [Sphingomonas panacis]
MLLGGASAGETQDAAAWLAAIVENSDDAILSKTLEGIITSWNPGAARLFGFSAVEAIGQPITIIIPEERRAEETTIIGKIRQGERVEHFQTVRRRKDGTLVDISLTVSPVRDRKGCIIGASKIARDITETRRAAERQMLLLREMNHRIKNLFALTTGLVTLSARGAGSVEQLKADLSERISSLARAHHLTLPEFGADPAANVTTLRALLEAILAPYDEIVASRVEIHGCDVPVGSGALTSLALLFHELATNAAKYGALSPDGGKLAIHVTTEGKSLTLHWLETAPAKLGGAPEREGFGSHLEQASIRGLRGMIERAWRPEGLAIDIRLPLAQLVS